MRRETAAINGLSALVLFLGFMLMMVDLSAAEPKDGPNLRESWESTLGGRLYDDWALTIGKNPPKTTHPNYPATSTQKGSTTWRCKECHGWDYRGKEGAYGKGSHYTGIKGINGMAGASLKKIVSILRDRTHRFNHKMLPKREARALARFVSIGQIGMGELINAKDKSARGDSKLGKRLYNFSCVKCHGEDGQQQNFKSATEPQFLGTLAWINPWEVIHKARFGQPGEYMLTYGEYFDRYASGYLIKSGDLADILSYTQSLPK